MTQTADLARDRYQRTTALQRALVAAIQRIWRALSPASIAADLEGEAGAAILAAVVAGQLTAAQGAQEFVAAALRAQGASAVPEALLVAEAFTGIAPDGGPLETLLYLPAIGVRRRIAAGATGEEAMLGGLSDMAMYAATAVADTGRSATQVAMAAQRGWVMYVRQVTLPACARCIILAGQTYSYSEGFLRHPNCDCGIVPVRSDGELQGMAGPQELFERMDARQQNAVFGKAAATAIREGADMGQVVNARRGVQVAQVFGRTVETTTEGVTKRGVYGRAMKRAGGEFVKVPGQRYARAAVVRLTPQEIFRQASGRDEQLELLRRYGYIV